LSQTAAYDIAPLYEAGVFGADQYVAIVSFDTYRPSDIEVFEQQLGIVGAPPIERIAVGEPLVAPGSGSGEVTLDVRFTKIGPPVDENADDENQHQQRAETP
jgi:subtilase family serine protease